VSKWATPVESVDEDINKFRLYPNPAVTELRLRFESRVKEAAIVDLYGRTVIELSLEQIQALNSGSETVINVSAIEPGAYFLKADGRFARKLIIQR
ncbi:MAG: T9SS type A sorting domain-containing protein, partial [Candidatus Kapaibacterium sp.]